MLIITDKLIWIFDRHVHYIRVYFKEKQSIIMRVDPNIMYISATHSSIIPSL